MTNSRSKGKRGELEVAAIFKKRGYKARRGQQFSGIGESPDVVHNMPNIHLEVKRVQALSLYKALQQAEGDRRNKDYPVIIHKRNREDWVAILYLDDWLDIMSSHPDFKPPGDSNE